MNFKVFSKGNLIKIIAVATLCPLMLLCGCKSTKSSVSTDSKNKTSSTSKTDKVSEPAQKGKDYTLINTYHKSHAYQNYDYMLVGIKDNVWYGEQMEMILRNWSGKEVLLDYVVAYRSETKPQNIKKFKEDIGAVEVYDGADISLGLNVYRVIGNPGTVENIKKAGYVGCYVDMLHNEDISRPDGYSEVISDSLAVLLEEMGENEMLEVAVATVANVTPLCYCPTFGHMIDSGGRKHSLENFNKLKSANNTLTYSQYEDLILQYTKNIIERNGIAQEKLIDDSVFGKILLQGNAGNFSAAEIEKNFASGFTARLTKAEILALAEDADIQLIHNDTVISTYTVYEE